MESIGLPVRRISGMISVCRFGRCRRIQNIPLKSLKNSMPSCCLLRQKAETGFLIHFWAVAHWLSWQENLTGNSVALKSMRNIVCGRLSAFCRQIWIKLFRDMPMVCFGNATLLPSKSGRTRLKSRKITVLMPSVL